MTPLTSGPVCAGRPIGFGAAYDGVMYWACPDCSGTWHRFAEGHPRYAAADAAMHWQAAFVGSERRLEQLRERPGAASRVAKIRADMAAMEDQ